VTGLTLHSANNAAMTAVNAQPLRVAEIIVVRLRRQRFGLTGRSGRSVVSRSESAVFFFRPREPLLKSDFLLFESVNFVFEFA